MKSNLLMNCMWYEDITPEEMAASLELTPEALFRKIFYEDDFTPGEISKIKGVLGLTNEEVNEIFYT